MEVDVVDNVSDIDTIRNDDDLLNLLDANLNIDANRVLRARTVAPEHLLQNSNTQQTFASIATFNTNPNSAIYLPSSYFGLELSDVANHQERWYAFSASANNKISITMQHFDGDYDLMLFELVGNSLNLVDYAATYNPLERISYVSETGGTYYLVAVPYALSTQNYFVFIVDVLSSFDAFEANDFYYQAPIFNNSIDVVADIDNSFDQDWFQLNVTTNGARSLVAMNAPAGHYVVSIYDRNLNLLGSFMADDIPRNMNFAVGTYYLQVQSLTGHRVDDDYRLVVTNVNENIFVHAGQVYILQSGQQIFVNAGQVYILQPGQQAVFDNAGRLHILQPGEEGFNVNNRFVIISVINGRLAIDRTYINLNGIFKESAGLGYRTLQEILVYDNGIRPNAGRGLLPGSLGSHGMVVAIDITNGLLHTFDNRNRPMSWFYTTRNNPLADNHTIVNGVTVYVSLSTGKLVEAGIF